MADVDRKAKKKAKKAKKLAEELNGEDAAPKSKRSKTDSDIKAAKCDSKVKAKKSKKDKKKKKKKSKDPNEAKPSSSAASEIPAAAQHDVAKSEKKSKKKDKAKQSNSDSNDMQAEWKSMNVTVKGHNDESLDDFAPFTSFSQVTMDPSIVAVCKGFDKPTAIQSCCWPIVLKGRDVIGVAATGSGKTLGFGLPALEHIQKLGKASSTRPHVLVLAPTRELAVQTYKVAQDAGKQPKVQCRSLCVYGGTPKFPQMKELRKGVEMLIATPGRLIDLMNDQAVSLDNVKYCVLDEADRMLDMGFEKDIRLIMGSVNSDRQTLMFSATWPPEVKKIAAQYLNKPIRVTVGSQELTANKSIEQTVEVVDPREKDGKLMGLLKRYPATVDSKVLVFALYKKEAARLESQLQRRGYDCVAMHGDLSQAQREASLKAFKGGKTHILIATDVAARGLDVKGIGTVINYTFPLTIEDYVHRIGRTGRAGATGRAHTLFTVHDKTHAGALGNVLREAGVEVPEALMKFGQHTKRKEHPVYGAFFKGDNGEPMKKASKIVFDSDED
eukprot:TRINITY_DN3691_c0_g1_i1.p1 TRINITY_DN3691_c0_g1~~TRINITY_DN3691_c0_g1_i1.p1  ORF type:complete len:568 (+),score=157.41 TRINITY_DN3691_c0_g1_i1:41-1705(+)